MNIFRTLGEILLVYIVYKLIFDFIIPVFQTTKQVKKQFGEMQSKMQEQMNTMNKQAAPKGPTASPTTKNEDYIDYEEIKSK